MQDFHNSGFRPKLGSVPSEPAADINVRMSFYFRAAWVMRKFVTLCAIAGILLGIVYALHRQPVFQASAVIGPPTNSRPSSTGLSALSLVTGGDSGDSGSFDTYLQILKANRLAALLEQRHHVLQHLHAKLWDAKTQRWKAPTGPIAWLKGLFRKPLSPSVEDLAETLKRKVAISTASSTGGLSDLRSRIRVVSVTYSDRAYAIKLLGYILAGADRLAREDQLADSANRIQYLERMLRSTTEVNLHESLTKLLVDQERIQMLAKVDKYYAFDMIDPPSAPLRSTGPSKTFIALIFMFAGLAVAGAVVFFVVQRGVARAVMAGEYPAEIQIEDPIDGWLRWLRDHFGRGPGRMERARN